LCVRANLKNLIVIVERIVRHVDGIQVCTYTGWRTSYLGTGRS
jgi:hypothetical protein